MTPPDVVRAFDAHAATYDQSLGPLLPVKALMHALLRSQLTGLPDTARILVAGAGTGAEARFLAPLFPRWRFTLADPSAAMLAVARRHAEAEGFAERCTFHAGFVSSLEAEPFDAVTSVLVSHFLTSADERQAYFASLAARTTPGGRLFEAALCADPHDPSFGAVMDLWLGLSGMPEERKGPFRALFGKDLAAHGPAEVEAMLERAGFSAPTPVFQAALVRGWTAARR